MTRFIWLIGAVTLVVAAVVDARLAVGQTTERKIEAIRVEGNRRIEAETVRSYMVIAVGDPFDRQRMDRSLKALFDTGLFFNVDLRREGNALVVRVVENPVINRIAFEGNKRITDETLSAEVQLRPRVIYTRSKIQGDVARLAEIYRRSGRFAATVEPKIIQLPQNRVDLVFEIDEGPLTVIRKISFIGNKRFSDSALRDEIETKESRWYRFLTSADTYDPDRLAFDRELLRRFYLSQGYADFRVESAIAELTRDRSGFFITFTLEEGERFRFGRVDLTSDILDLDVEELSGLVLTQSGDWYDADAVEDTIQDLTDAIGNLGFAFVDIRPRVARDREARTIGLTYEIFEGSRVFVERINITGNFRTLDEVIRREFRVVEGDPYSAARLRRSQQRIRNLGFFDKVEIESNPGSSDDRAIIDVEVAERSTGELFFGAGVSSVDGLLADVGARERNLLGRGQNLSLSFQVSGRRQEIDLSFTEPYFLERELAAGFDIFRRTTDLTDANRFEQSQLGLAFRVGYPITERLRQTLTYTIRRDEIEDVAAGASRFIREQEGSSLTMAIGQRLLYDVRDSRIDPTEGFFVRLQQDLAGIGGNVRYLSNQVSGTYYHPIAEDWVGSLSGGAGHIFGYAGKDVAINDRFFIGGSKLRGFDTAGIGPRDSTTNDALGGNLYAVASAQLSFPIGLPSEFKIRGRLFTDVGTLTDIDVEGSDVVDEASLRASIGVGLSVLLPVGPMIIDFAVPVVKEDFDDTEAIRFSFGTRF